IPPKIDLAAALPKSVLGTSTDAGDKHIYVDLTTQKLYAYEGNNLYFQTFISSGKWDPTPVGNFHIWEKLVATRMAGGSGADAYDLPNVPYTMFFSNDEVPKDAGFSLHGAYWHNNFGHPMSHGCVNMRIIDAQALYNWVDPQTTGYTSYATDSTPGTLVSICSQIQINGTTRECIK
ncbi:MAG: L,D-transpeptidase, partial [Patescibacteria group bacterium]|nr:L,D-transpeptidase [Patescibacteria group bacterium]